jgi:predicted transcriptional regulator
MSRAITYLAPVDAQKEIIAGWKEWLQEIEKGEKLRPLGPEAPPEQWLW